MIPSVGSIYYINGKQEWLGFELDTVVIYQ